MTLNEKRNAYKAAVIAAGVDPNKDYFALSFGEKSKVNEIRKAFKHNSKHCVRSKLQCFWYSMQNAK